MSPYRDDGIKNIINKIREGERDHMIQLTEEDILKIRASDTSPEEHKALFDAAKGANLFKSPTNVRPELIAREGQQNMTGDQLADLLMAKMRDSVTSGIPYTGTRVGINSWSNVGSTFRAWGDYWAWFQLGQGFTELGYHFNPDSFNRDVTIYLRGGKFIKDHNVMLPNRINPDTYNIVWVYSHPDLVTFEELKDFDEVFCLSESLVDKLSKWHPNVIQAPLVSCSNMTIPENPDTRFDIVFIGNARGGSINENGRDVIKDLEPPEDCKVGIWGMKWDLPHLQWVRDKGWWQGHYYPYFKLNQLYGGAKIVVHDTHPDMAQFGMIPMKILDVIKSGGFVIMDDIKGAFEHFNQAIPVYKDANGLNTHIRNYLDNSKERKARSDKAREIIKDQTFTNAARHIIKHSKFEWKERTLAYKEFLNV